jgi:hypothetical protein
MIKTQDISPMPTHCIKYQKNISTFATSATRMKIDIDKDVAVNMA